jgi:hypothetical protein
MEFGRRSPPQGGRPSARSPLCPFAGIGQLPASADRRRYQRGGGRAPGRADSSSWMPAPPPGTTAAGSGSPETSATTDALAPYSLRSDSHTPVGSHARDKGGGTFVPGRWPGRAWAIPPDPGRARTIGQAAGPEEDARAGSVVSGPRCTSEGASLAATRRCGAVVRLAAGGAMPPGRARFSAPGSRCGARGRRRGLPQAAAGAPMAARSRRRRAACSPSRVRGACKRVAAMCVRATREGKLERARRERAGEHSESTSSGRAEPGRVAGAQGPAIPAMGLAGRRCAPVDTAALHVGMLCAW